ncbi:FMN-dependent NADH-azoreductase [Bosea sp. PAMC 26642]|uniref:FMN-dependent NADH-azoreductase n=1 Tax=Bosea sp. (strain PAMC 26642) TaxID=1792307 RepID=UPI00076FF2C3|nr:NAD(P)H-dependent oxidoreductase [Bosea sp. PAMC 26642]AMJ59258.1 FMN-dependent NADH-azoreductase [Bosea sp. PAMC 26642]
MKLLHLDSSILSENSVSREVSAAIVARLRQTDPGLDVTYRDLAADPVPHLSGAYLAAASGAPGMEDFRSEIATGAAIMDEFLAADIVVIGAPMYNFSIPTQLKAWIDRIAVAGKTFRYTEKGPEGLAGGKRLIVAISRGNNYSAGAPAAPNDFQQPYLRAVFSFLGVTDIEFITAEGIAFGPEQRKAALAGAREAAAVLKAPLAQAA